MPRKKRRPEPVIDVIEIFEHDPEVVRLLKLALTELRAIRRELYRNIPTLFHITQEDSMAITGIIPGQSGTFSANPSGQPDPSKPLTVVPVWTSSDPAAVVTASEDGLTATVAVDAAAGQGGSFELSVSNPDGSAKNTVTVPYDAIPVQPNVPTAFAIDQTA